MIASWSLALIIELVVDATYGIVGMEGREKRRISASNFAPEPIYIECWRVGGGGKDRYSQCGAGRS